jgi:hypothetical protein
VEVGLFGNLETSSVQKKQNKKVNETDNEVSKYFIVDIGKIRCTHKHTQTHTQTDTRHKQSLQYKQNSAIDTKNQ